MIASRLGARGSLLATVVVQTFRSAVIVIAASLLLASNALAQDTHLLMITGVGGDDEHTQNFHKWASTIISAAKERGGLTDTTITYLGDKPELDASHIKARSTRENVQKAFTDLATQAKAADEVFVVLIGHGSFDGQKGSFNLAGPDLSADDYAKLLEKIPAQRIVFVNTASSSGAFVQPLAGPGRTIVTSTKTGGEKNEPIFVQFFAEAFADTSADTDRNGRVSVTEAFEYAKAKVTASYQKAGTIMTEHATLDDGREGKFAATLFLESDRARAAKTASVANPELRALIEAQQKLENDVTALRLKKDILPAAEYEQQLEKLLTELAQKGRAIRELEAAGKK
jgi:Peptidase C13 family